LLARKQASSHSHELTPKQGVSYNVASVEIVDVKQDDILPQRKARPPQWFIARRCGDLACHFAARRGGLPGGCPGLLVSRTLSRPPRNRQSTASRIARGLAARHSADLHY
jgi:hypothetical protein